MSLTSALHIGTTGLLVNQHALEVTGNNLANAATEGYSRQRVTLAAGTPVDIGGGNFIGTGVRLQQIARVVDDALNGRLRGATSEQFGAQARQDVLTQIESIQNSLSDQDLSTRLSEFFGSFSELANSPTDAGLRSLVVSEGRSLAEYLSSVNDDLVSLRQQVDDRIRAGVAQVDTLLTRIATINQQIAVAESGQSGANSLRDQRDALLDELSQFMDITVNEQPSGTVDVFNGSTPLVLGATSRGLDVEIATDGENLTMKLRVRQDGQVIDPRSGTLGALIASRTNDVQNAIDELHQFTATMIHEVNKVHASGQGEVGFSQVTSFNGVADAAVALNDADAQLDFTPVNGTFHLHVTQKSTGATTTTQIDVDLDGIGADTTLTDLAAAIDAAANVSASVGLDGRLTITSDSADFEFTFADDSSGVLASLGINTFFTGKNAAEIGVNQRLIDNPNLLAAAQNGVRGDNRNALALAEMADTSLESLGGLTLRQSWARHVEDYAIRADQATQNVEATTVIAEGLTTQKQSVSGVSLDEEAINMLMFQRAFQGAARFITVVDELTQTMLNMIR